MAESLNTGKIAEVIFESVVDTFELNTDILNRVDFYRPDATDLQNARNQIWRPVQQQTPVVRGWNLDLDDLTEEGILELNYRNQLGEPINDIVELQADNLRDPQFWKRRGREAGRKLAAELNLEIAEKVVEQGSLHYFHTTGDDLINGATSTPNPYSFVGQATKLMNEREVYNSGTRTFIFNNDDARTFAGELGAKQTEMGHGMQAWEMHQLGQNISGFDLFEASYLPTILNEQIENIMIEGVQQFDALATDDDGLNVDYREARILMSGTNVNLRSIEVGDKLTIAGINAVSLKNKKDLGELMQFTVIANGLDLGSSATSAHITVYPRPFIQARTLSAQSALYLSDNQQAYINSISGSGDIPDNAAVAFTSRRTAPANSGRSNVNIFFDKGCVEVMGGAIPAKLFSQYDGHKVIMERMKNGQIIYMLYSGNIDNMTFTFRCFTWYGITVRDPFGAGVAELTGT